MTPIEQYFAIIVFLFFFFFFGEEFVFVILSYLRLKTLDKKIFCSLKDMKGRASSFVILQNNKYVTNLLPPNDKPATQTKLKTQTCVQVDFSTTIETKIRDILRDS